MLLETIQVARHLGQLGLKPLEKVATEAGKAGEELAFWTLKLRPVEELLGRDRTKQVKVSLLQAKDVMVESVASLSHQSMMSTLQNGAQVTTFVLRQAGLHTRVVGPFDAHWNTLKVLKDLRTASEEAAETGGSSIRLTPKRFVQFMREAERKKRRTLTKDPVEEYVEWIMRNGSLSSMAPLAFEKKLYTDVVRLICFAFDRALMQANGAEIWGHQLRVKVAKEAGEDMMSKVPRARSDVGIDQVEVVVNRLLADRQDLKPPLGMEGMQRQLLVNCTMMILQLIEDLTSERHMQVTILGHALRISLEPLALDQLLDASYAEDPRRSRINAKAVDELVDALIEEPEVQLVLVPDIVEAEVYRFALRRMMCIAQYILAQLRIRLFGIEVTLQLESEDGAESDDPDAADEPAMPRAAEVVVPHEALQGLLDRIEDERMRVDKELRSRRGETEVQKKRSSFDTPCALDQEEGPHPFHALAAQDRLSRSLSVQRVVAVPIDVAYGMVSNFDQYPKWMPFCTSARAFLTEDGKEACEVSFGVDTGTALGVVGDRIRYRVRLISPNPGTGVYVPRVARVVADTHDSGFTYGKRLVYDWRFFERADGETDVRLDMFFQAKRVFFLPIWDSMQGMIMTVMMREFNKRAAELMRAQGLSQQEHDPVQEQTAPSPVFTGAPRAEQPRAV